MMVGLSVGADMWFDLLRAPGDEPTPRVDGLLSLEGNLSLDTCFVSQVLASLTPDRPDMSVAELRRISDKASSLDDWVNIHEHLVRVLGKLRGGIGIMQRAPADSVRPCSCSSRLARFARW